LLEFFFVLFPLYFLLDQKVPKNQGLKRTMNNSLARFTIIIETLRQFASRRIRLSARLADQTTLIISVTLR
jgi:hypothetical protein